MIYTTLFIVTTSSDTEIVKGLEKLSFLIIMESIWEEDLEISNILETLLYIYI